MKTISVIGDISFESTTEYYNIINKQVNQQLSGYHSAKILLYSVDFQKLKPYKE